jgi:hypothetical protein
MDAKEFILTGHIWWLLTGQEVVSPPLSALRDWSVVSPLAEVSTKHPPRGEHLIPFSDGTYLFSTDRLMLAKNFRDAASATDDHDLYKALHQGFVASTASVCWQKLPLHPTNV